MQPGNRAGELLKASFFKNGIVRAFLKVHDDFMALDFDRSLCADKMTKQFQGRRLSKAFKTAAQTLVQHRRYDRQRQIKVYVQPYLAAQTVQMKKRDLLTQ